MSRTTRTVPLFLCVSTLSSGALCACVGSFAAPEDAFSRNIAPPPATEGAGLVGARVRLLNRFEYNNTIRALFGDTTDPADAFPPAATQSGFSNNAAQATSPLLVNAYHEAASTLAAKAVASLATLLPCDPGAIGEDACAARFITTFSSRAFRRPLTPSEVDALGNVYRAARDDGDDLAGGIAMVIYAVLNAPSFLYVTELGDDGAGSGAAAALTPYETASALSYLAVGGPPDEALMLAAAADALRTPEQREAQLRRLLERPEAMSQARRFFSEWLEIRPSTKDAVAYPEHEALSPSLLAETQAFIDDVVFRSDGTLRSLLLADYTFVDAPLARFYGLEAGGFERVSLAESPRRGILMHASFLSAHGNNATSSPIKRGTFVRRKLLCQALPPPPPNVNVTTPDVGPSSTTRQTFDAHVANPSCSSCHTLIDPIGNGFEAFDGEGRFRTTENGQPIDARGEVTSAQDADGTFANATELVSLLAGSNIVSRCYTRQLLRFSSATTSDDVERAFLAETEVAPTDRYQDLLVAYVRSPIFAARLIP